VYICICSSVHLFIFVYLQNISPLYSVSCFRTMFHKTAGCIKWARDLFIGMSVRKCVSA
jgi:hypothetical protein